MGGFRGNRIHHISRFMSLIKQEQSIYPDSTAATTTERPGATSGDKITLELPISLDECRLELVSDAVHKPSDNILFLALSHLPSVSVTLYLPPSYPCASQPRVMSISCSHSWLSDEYIEQLTANLRNKLEDTPLNDSGVLWDMCEWFRSGEFLRSMKLLTPNGLRFVNS